MATNRYPMGISPRKDMASGGIAEPGNNFGVSQVVGGVPAVANMDRGMSHAAMPDSKRHAPIPRGGKKLHNQRNPDHGPHHIGAMHPAGSMRGGRGDGDADDWK